MDLELHERAAGDFAAEHRGPQGLARVLAPEVLGTSVMPAMAAERPADVVVGLLAVEAPQGDGDQVRLPMRETAASMVSRLRTCRYRAAAATGRRGHPNEDRPPSLQPAAATINSTSSPSFSRTDSQRLRRTPRR